MGFDPYLDRASDYILKSWRVSETLMSRQTPVLGESVVVTGIRMLHAWFQEQVVVISSLHSACTRRFTNARDLRGQ